MGTTDGKLAARATRQPVERTRTESTIFMLVGDLQTEVKDIVRRRRQIGLNTSMDPSSADANIQTAEEHLRRALHLIEEAYA